MKTYLNNLNERERWMVVGAILCIFIYCYYLFLYAPLSKKVEQRSTQLIEKMDTLEWMKKIKNKAHASNTKKNWDSNQLLTLLANKLKDNSTLKFPYHLQQTNTGDIQLTFDEVPFNLFISWLMKINDHYAIVIKQFDVTNTQTPGMVKLMIMINKAP